jgi:predicted DCC family thiol-disulfide oxidoreductase YuxK
MMLVLYDGECGLCNRFVRFLLVRDRSGRLHYAALQSPRAVHEFGVRGITPPNATMAVIGSGAARESQCLTKSRAVLAAIGQLGGAWSAAAKVASVVPHILADRAYDLVAKHRHRLFRPRQECLWPTAAWKSRFVDDEPVSRPSKPLL